MKKNNFSNSFWEKKILISYALSILVFWIHCSSFSNYKLKASLGFVSFFLQDIITPVAVPLFFIISGVLFFRDYTNKKYKTKLKSRLFSLIIPFIAWNTINMVFEIITSVYFSQYFVGRKAFEFSFLNVLLGLFHYKYNGVFWFVFALIMFAIASPLLNALLTNKYFGASIILILAILSEFNIGLPTPFFYNQTCIIFYLIGAWIGKYLPDFFVREHYSVKEKVISGVMIVLSWVYFVLSKKEILSKHQLVEVVVLLVYAVSLWICFDTVSSRVKPRDFMKNSFLVFSMHINVGAIVAKLLFIVLPKVEFFSVVNFVLTTVFTLALINLFASVLKTTAPPLFKVLSGNR